LKGNRFDPFLAAGWQRRDGLSPGWHGHDQANRLTQAASLADGQADYDYDHTDQLTSADYDFQAAGWHCRGSKIRCQEP
jgi:hypothetical protein